jgi:uncharacterized OsmC-like protein
MKNLMDEPGVVNGVDTAQLTKWIGQLKERPDTGNIKYRCQSSWQEGTRVLHHFAGYEIDGTSLNGDNRRFVILTDEFNEFGVKEVAPTPYEHLLGALSGDITATINAHASLNNIHLTNLQVECEGEMNVQGMFDLRRDLPIGFKTILVKVTISGDAPEAKLMEMVDKGYKFSPVRNTISSGIRIDKEFLVE